MVHHGESTFFLSFLLIYFLTKNTLMKLKNILPLLLAILFCFQLKAQEIGPKNGALVIVGGGGAGPEIIKRFVDLAGGSRAKIVYIPTAGGRQELDLAYKGRVIQPFLDQGAQEVRVVHTYDPEEADTDEFVQAINEATGVWFSGGRQWRIVDAYAGTKAEVAFQGVLDRGGVIGGSSAGATIQGSYLARGDTQTNTIMMGDHEVGFGYLKNSAIDQHLLRRNRQFDLIEVIKAKPELLGIGLDEKTAIIVEGDEFTVMGPSYVAIYDHEVLEKSGRFYFLAEGDRFDLKERKPMRRSVRYDEMELPAEFKGNN
jgi:cyanophycinase